MSSSYGRLQSSSMISASKYRNGDPSISPRSYNRINNDRTSEYRISNVIDEVQGEYNVKNKYKQLQDSLEEKEQEFIQHLRTLSILSSSSTSSPQSLISNANSSSSSRSSDHSTSSNSQKNKGILLIDEFLDLRKSRRQFVSMLYNHIQNNHNEFIIPLKNAIKSLKIELHKREIELNNRINDTDHQQLHNHQQQLEVNYQKLLKALDSKENELTRIKLYQEKLRNQITEELSAEYTRKLSSELHQLTLQYESKLRLLESKLNSITTAQQQQQHQQRSSSNHSTPNDQNKYIADNNNTINHSDNNRYEDMEKMYLAKLQKYKEVVVALSEREHELKDTISKQELKLQACGEKIELLKGINTKLDNYLNDEKKQKIELQAKISDFESKLNILMIKFKEQQSSLNQQKEATNHEIKQLKQNHEQELKNIDEKVRGILHSKDEKIQLLQNQYNQLLDEKNDIQHMMNELNANLKV